MACLKQIFVGCVVLTSVPLLLLYFEQIPSFHPKTTISKFMSNYQAIKMKWFVKSQAVNTSSSTNQVLFHTSSTNQSREAHFKSMTDQNKVSNTTLLKTNANAKERIKAKPKTGKKYMIYHCSRGVCGGFGDRQAGIVSVFLLANITKRKFGLIFSKPCNIRKYLYPNEVQWDIPSKEYSKLNKQFFTFIKRKYLNIVETSNFDELFKGDAIFLKTNYIMFDYIKRNTNYKSKLKWLQNVTYSQYFAEIYRKLFKPNDYITRTLEKTVKPSKTNGTKLICAQIRIGRNPSMPGDTRRNSRKSVEIVWDFLHRYNDTRLYRIFVSTDSESVRKESQHLFANQSVMNPPGKIVHIDFTHKASPSVCQGMQKVILDQYVLMHCDVLVHSRSAFGENAARLMKGKSEIYVFKEGVISPSDIVYRKYAYSFTNWTGAPQ